MSVSVKTAHFGKAQPANQGVIQLTAKSSPTDSSKVDTAYGQPLPDLMINWPV